MGAATTAATGCGVTHAGEWILTGVGTLSVELDLVTEQDAEKFRHECWIVRNIFDGHSRVSNDTTLAGLNRRLRKTARTGGWED